MSASNMLRRCSLGTSFCIGTVCTLLVWSCLFIKAAHAIITDERYSPAETRALQQEAQDQQQERIAPHSCLCTKSGATGANATFCATLIGPCENMARGSEFTTLSEAKQAALAGYNCRLVETSSQFTRQTSPADLSHLCPNEPYDGLSAAAEVLSPTPTPPGGSAPPAAQFVTPELGVPIPGLTFGQAQLKNGNVEVPFLAQYISAIQRYLIGLAVTAALVMIVYGGFLYLLGASIGEIGRGKTIITDAIVGLLFVLGSYTILNIVNPNTTKLDSIKFLSIEPEVLGSGADEIAMENTPGGTLPTQATANSGEPPPGTNPGPPPESRDLCARPGFLITSFSDFHGSINASAQTIIQAVLGNPTRLARYRTAAEAQHVPWQVLLAIHINEGSAREDGSILNGGTLCNHSNSSCGSICNTPTPENDIMCGAIVLKNKEGPFTIDNMDKLQRALNDYIGYGGSLACDEASMIGFGWNASHTGTVEQPHDCVPVNCRGGCISDYTGTTPPTRGCCTITVWNIGSNHPQRCNQNHGPAVGQGFCEVARNGDQRTFQYNRGENDRSRPRGDPARNPCGAWRSRGRTGHLAMIAYILQQPGGR